MENKRRREERRLKVSETRGGSVLVLAVGSILVASHFADGVDAAWLALVVFLMCVAVAFLAGAEVVIELEGDDGDE